MLALTKENVVLKEKVFNTATILQPITITIYPYNHMTCWSTVYCSKLSYSKSTYGMERVGNRHKSISLLGQKLDYLADLSCLCEVAPCPLLVFYHQDNSKAGLQKSQMLERRSKYQPQLNRPLGKLSSTVLSLSENSQRTM